MNNPDFLQELNEAQQQAVKNTEGPSLVIAGAGSGKTRVLTYRIAWLLKQGVPAHQILALTFTNKAAKEMKERIMSLVGPQTAMNLWMGTFHSVFAKILRIDAEALGYKTSYTIYDSTDSRTLIKKIIKDMNLDDKVYKPASVAGRISAAKNNLITARAYLDNEEIRQRDVACKIPAMAEIYKTYAIRCFRSGAMDFDDLLLNTNILFRDHPAVLEKYQERFRYVLVDEYQDTNYSQYLIVKKMVEKHHNVCAVGDDAQSIYSFRGARIENILNFKNDYPEYQLFKLEQNYRSTQTIVKAANSIIAKNRGQIQKVVFSKNDEGMKIRLLRAMTDSEEGFLLANQIMDTRLSDQQHWYDFAVLYRTNAQSRIFEEALRKKNIPYRVYGGLSFYERKEIKDLLAYFRMVVNALDEESLRRVINYPKRGIGATTVEKLFALADHLKVSVWQVLEKPEVLGKVLPAAAIKKVCGFAAMIRQFQEQDKTMNAYELAREIANASGIITELRNGQTPEEVSRYENIQELLNAIKEFSEDAHTNGDPESLEAYMANVALLTDRDTEKEEDRDRVSLMTMHSAKGLEFNYVFVAGMEENLFPSHLSSHSPRELEEERRLFYVAVTRARKQVTLSYALNRYIWGNLESSSPSRFLQDVDERFIEAETGSDSYMSYRGIEKKPQGKAAYEDTGSRSPSFRQKQNLTSMRSAAAKAPAPGTSDAPAANIADIREGVRVEHQRFGKGIVKTTEGSAPDIKAVVDFDQHGIKKLLLRFARLRILE